MDGWIAGAILVPQLVVLVHRYRAKSRMVLVKSDPAFSRVNPELELFVVKQGGPWSNEDVLVLRRLSDQKLWAIGNSCPHAGYPLHEGDIEDLSQNLCGRKLGAPVVSCPAHAYLFDMERGTCITVGSCPPTPAYRARMCGKDLYLSQEPLSGREIGTHVLNREESNALQLEMVTLSLAKRYGPGS